MIIRHLPHLILASLLIVSVGAGQEVKKGPYAVELSAKRLSMFVGQQVQVALTLTNESSKVGPAVSRSTLAGRKNFICARPPRSASESWQGEWAKVVGKPGSGSITLHPGESFTMNVLLSFPEEIADGPGAIHVEWRGRSGPLKGVITERVIFQVQAGSNPIATLETNKGTIILELWPDKAPNHVANFVELAQKKFYDDKVFHRVIKGFMIQTGCPEGTGLGNPGYFLKDEFGEIPFKKGVLGAANTGKPNSAGSQFFICVADAPHLNGKYTAYGRVLEGQDVADGISNVSTDATGPKKDRPHQEIRLKSVRVALPKGYEKPEVEKQQG